MATLLLIFTAVARGGARVLLTATDHWLPGGRLSDQRPKTRDQRL